MCLRNNPSRNCCAATNSVYDDLVYSSQQNLTAEVAPKASDFTNQKRLRNNKLTKHQRENNLRKSSVRTKVKHVFLITKHIFGLTKVNYHGMVKNRNRLSVVASLANLFMARHHLLRVQHGRGVR